MGVATSTLSAEAMAESWHFLSEFSLDPQGAAHAFRFLYGTGEQYDVVRICPPIAYDSATNVWRVFTLDSGWTVKRSIQEEMNDVMGAMCAIEAFEIVDRETPPKPEEEMDPDEMASLQHPWDNPPDENAPRKSEAEVNAGWKEAVSKFPKIKKDPEKEAKRNAKADKEYHKLRARNLGSNVSRAIVNAQTLMSVEEWDFDDMSLGLPQAEQLYVTPSNPQVGVCRPSAIMGHVRGVENPRV